MMQNPRRYTALLALTLAITPAVTAESPLPALRVQHLAIATGAHPGQPSVAVDPREGFVLTWQERESESASLWFAVIDRTGREQRRGRIASGTNWFVNWADFPSLAVLENGDWVTHYLEKTAGSPYAYDVRLVRSSDRGVSWGHPSTPHTDRTATQHGFVSLAPLEKDRVLVVWLDGRRGAGTHSSHGEHEEEAPMTLRAAVVDRAGARHEERELDEGTCSCCQTDVARFGAETLIAYRDRTANEIRDIATVRRSATGAWSQARILHADGWRIEGCPVNGPAVTARGERWLAVWPTQVNGQTEVRYRLSTMNGAQRLDAGPGSLGRVDAVSWTTGFLVTWLGGGTNHAAGLQLAQLDANGRMLGTHTISAVPPTRMSGNPRLAADGDRALLAWIGPEADAPGNRLRVALLYR